jgi:phage head maturation protease
MIQYRAVVDGEVRDVDESKRQVQVVIPHERIDTYNTDFARDCFRASFEQRLPKMAWMHIPTEPIGHAIRAQITGSANELIAQFSDLDAVPRARQAFTQIRDGDITDFSFGFDRAVPMAHPEKKGAIRFREARMKEISPVMTGSVPGAVAVGVRAEADIAGVAELVREKVISPEEAREMLHLAATVPSIGDRADEIPEWERKVMDEQAEREERERIEIQPATDPGADPEAPDDDATETNDQPGDEDTADLARAVDEALGQADELLADVDTAALPEPVARAVALVRAAGVASDELLDSLGLAGERAPKPYGDVEYADPKNGKYPIDTEKHIRAAWSYISQGDNAAKYSADELKAIKGRIRAAAKKVGIDISDDRAEDPDVDQVRARLSVLATR